jgi:hypothetical protein
LIADFAAEEVRVSRLMHDRHMARRLMVPTIVCGAALLSMGTFTWGIGSLTCSENVHPNTTRADICGVVATNRAALALTLGPLLVVALTAVLGRHSGLITAAFVTLLAVQIVVLLIVLLGTT